MRPLPNVLRAMQSIQQGIEEVQVNLVKLGVSTPNDVVLLEACTVTLKRIWEEANSYEQALPAFAPPFNSPS